MSRAKRAIRVEATQRDHETQTEWHYATTLTECSADTALNPGSLVRKLPIAWRILLLGDGSVTKLLETAGLTTVHINLLGEQQLEGSETVIREVVLQADHGTQLVHAVSEWDATELRQLLPEANQPIWRNLAMQRREIYREIQTVAQVTNKRALRQFGCNGNDTQQWMWARQYVLYSNSRLLTRVQETFSPELSEWLGNDR